MKLLILILVIIIALFYVGKETMLGDGSQDFYTFINLYPGLRWTKVSPPLLIQLKKIPSSM